MVKKGLAETNRDTLRAFLLVKHVVLNVFFDMMQAAKLIYGLLAFHHTTKLEEATL